MLKLTKILMGTLLCFSLVPVAPSLAEAKEVAHDQDATNNYDGITGGRESDSVQGSQEGSSSNAEDGGSLTDSQLPQGPQTDAKEDDVTSRPEVDTDAAPSEEAGSNSLTEDEEKTDGQENENVEAAPELALFSARATSAVGGINIITNRNSGKPLDVASGSSDDYANVQQYEDNNTPAQRFRVEPAGEGCFFLLNVNSGKALDVSAASKVAGTNVQQYTNNKTAAQKWMFVPVDDAEGYYYIVSALTGGKEDLTGALVLDVSGASETNGVNIQVYTYNGTKAQQFSFDQINQVVPDGAYQIRSTLSSSAVLDVAGASNSDYGNVQIYGDNGSAAQKFILKYNDKTGYYTIQNVHSAKVLDVSGAATVNGANVQQYSSNSTNAQKWSIEKSSDGNHVIRSGCSGLVLDVSGGSAENGTNVQGWQENNTTAQKWSFVEVKLLSEGAYEVKSALGTVLDAASGGVSEGTNIQSYAANATMAQKYYLYDVGAGYYRLEAMKSGLAVGLANASDTNVCLVANTGADSQLWKPIVAGGGQYYLSNKASGAVLDVQNASSASGANAWTYGNNGSNAQKWSFVPTGIVSEGQYTLSSALDPKKVLDIAAGSTSNGAKLQIYENNNSPAQMFKAESIGSGYYRIVNMGSNKSLDVVDGKINTATGAGDVQQWESNSNLAQKWKFEYAGGGFFTLFSAVADGRYCLDVQNASPINNNPVWVYRTNGSSAQKFKLNEISGISYIQYNISLAEMAKYQKDGNPYLSLPDGSRDVPVSEITAALDPANSPGSIFYQFADLRIGTGLSGAQLNAYISTNGKSGVLVGKGEAFSSAAKRYGLNEAYLVAHTCVESGWGKSRLAKGAYYDGNQYEYVGKDGKTYVAKLSGYPAGTYYNLFGIGAVDTDPHKYGVEKAIKEGWSTVDSAISGSARWIASNYVYASSYPDATLYDMKWDIARSNADKKYGWHQYATDIQWARTIARLMGDCYAAAGVSNPTIVYRVPAYR